MDNQETFVIVCRDGDELCGISDEIERDQHLESLRQGLESEEITQLIDRSRFETDVRQGFKDGRASVWKQFYLDMRRQDLIIDAHNGRELGFQRMVQAMHRMIKAVQEARTDHNKRLAAEERERVRLQQEARRTRFARLSMVTGTYFADLFTYWVATTFGKHFADWLIPGGGSGGVTVTAAGARPQRTITICDNNDEAMYSIVTRGSLYRPPQQPHDVSQIPPPPEVTPENADVSALADTLALFCQQGVVAKVFELLNKKYSSPMFDVHVSDSTQSLSIQVFQKVNEDGEPDVCVHIQKLFRLLDITDAENPNIGTLSTEIELFLFSEQEVQLKWTGHSPA